MTLRPPRAEQIVADDLVVVVGGPVKAPRPLTSPSAQTPSTLVRNSSSTGMKPRLSISTPALSSSSWSVLGLRPIAIRRCVPAIVRGAPSTVHLQPHAIAGLGDGEVAGADHDLDPFRLEQPPRQRRDVVVLAEDQAIGVFDDRHRGAEAAENLRELQTDVTAAGDDQPAGQDVEIEHGRVVERADARQPRPIRHRRARADVEQDLRRRHPFAVDLDRLVADEDAVAAKERKVGGRADPRGQAGDGGVDDGVLARLHRLHVDRDRADADSVIGGATRHMRDPGAGDQRFGRRAAVVDAGAAEMLALDQRGFPAGLGQLDGEERPGLTRADDDGVEFLRHAASTSVSAAGDDAARSGGRRSGLEAAERGGVSSVVRRSVDLAGVARWSLAIADQPTTTGVTPAGETRACQGSYRPGAFSNGDPTSHEHVSQGDAFGARN